MELLYAETCPVEETHRFLLCELAHDLPDPADVLLSPLEKGCSSASLSSATHHPKTILPHLRQVVALTWLSSSPYWSEGETYFSHRFQTMARKVFGAPQDTDTPTLQRCSWNRGDTEVGARSGAHCRER